MIEWKRRQIFARGCSVSFQSWMNQWHGSDVNEVAQVLGKQLLIIGSEMCYVFDFSWKIVVIVVQSGLELYDFTILAAGVEPNKFVIRSNNGTIMCRRHVPVWSNWRQFELEQVISVQLRNKITVVRNVKIHHLSLLNAEHKTQLFLV